MFLYHPDTEHLGQMGFYKFGWKAVVVGGAGELPRLVSKYLTSPCIWAKGVRLRSNFIFAEWIALDFDKSLTLGEALSEFEPYIHCIGTTKSHQIAKGLDGPRDRFRVFLKFTGRVKRWQDYEETVRLFVKRYGADAQAVAASQPFMPVREVVSIKYWGKLVEPVLYDDEMAKIREMKKKERDKVFGEEFEGQRRIPKFVRDWLEDGCPDGRRNITCFKAGSWLFRCGFDENEIVRMIMASPIPLSAPGIEGEVRDAVRRGISRART